MKKRRDAGFAMVTAIFLLVVLAALGAFMITLSGVHQATPFQALTASRVYYGAKAGLDWGIQRAIATGSCAGSSTVNLTGSGLNGVTAIVSCTTGGLTHTGGNVYRITSTGSYGTFGSVDYARRQLQATVTDIP
jgi:MSHA biogenesis protein MshP